MFDSGYGGLTVLRELRRALPDRDFIYLGDNARAPYGTRSFELVYQFTLQAVRYLFGLGCPLVILACNTASAKALRTIQQKDLDEIDPSRRVLGVIRPTVEAIGNTTETGSIGLFGTPGTVTSRSYDIEISKMYPGMKVYSHACPMWVPLVENSEYSGPGADYFVRKDIKALFNRSAEIDTLILGCTHYPLLLDKIRQYLPSWVKVLSQGAIVAESLVDYLRRHPEMDERITRGGTVEYLTTEQAEKFSALARLFMAEELTARTVTL